MSLVQALHGWAITDGFRLWQQCCSSWFEQLLRLTSLSALPAKLLKQPRNDSDQRADPPVKQPSKISGSLQTDPFPVLLGLQLPQRARQHSGNRKCNNKNGSWEQLAVMLMKYTEEQLKYQMDKKAWHSHTNTGTAALIPQPYKTSDPH